MLERHYKQAAANGWLYGSGQLLPSSGFLFPFLLVTIGVSGIKYPVLQLTGPHMAMDDVGVGIVHVVALVTIGIYPKVSFFYMLGLKHHDM